MKKLIGLLFVLPVAVGAPHPPPIASISVCSPDSHDGMLQQGSCDWGTFDTHQPVLGPEGTSVNSSKSLGAGIGVVPDEHSSVFGPLTLGTNQDYIFFLATGLGGNAHIGVSVLSGGAGPNQFGQWTLSLPTADGYGSYGSGSGPVFNPSTKGSICPPAPNNDKTQQDQTFDMHYAASGSIVVDPTAARGSLLMVYEGANACIGNAGGAIYTNDDYISLAIATSVDYGKTWPTYRGNPPAFNFAPLPGVNLTQAPNAPLGALGANVCKGNDCSTTPPPPASYGRYPVVTPSMSLDSLMKAGVALTDKYGEQEISGFVDDVSPISPPYLYVNSGDVRIARAPLNGGVAPLSFEKWNWSDKQYDSPGLGGDETSVLQTGPNAFPRCLATAQNQFGSSISYVDSTKQYLLTFVCVSTGDPKLGPNRQDAARGAAWFYATSYDPGDPKQWSMPDPSGNPQPREIDGSWSLFDPASTTCPYYKGWYPSFMSLDTNPGHISDSGHVFYLEGCQGGGDGEAPARLFASRAFKITKANGHR